MEEGVAGRDLVPLDAANVSKVHNGFAEILRHHHISDRQGAFDTLLSLCLCKCVDEADGGDEAPAFRAPVGEPADALLARLLTLYRRGMRRYFDEEVIAGVHALAFRRIDTAAHLARNAEVLAEVVRLLAPYRLTGSREPVLGNLFELLLNDGLKQAVGQFFTPTPVAALAVAALPIDGIVRARQAEGHRSPVPRIIDPACGSGHFLTEAARALAALPGVDALPAHTLVGIERDDRLARAARIGALMHGVPVIDIRCGEGLDHPAALGPPGDFDVVLANPPYSIKGFRRYLQLANNRLELLEHVTDAGAEIEAVFVERAAQLLRQGGVAALVLPTSILANSDGRVVWMDQSENYQQRSDPDHVLTALCEHLD